MALCKYDEVLLAVPERDRGMVGLAANRCMNMVAGQRPSDAARSAVREYKSLGRVAFIERFRRERGLLVVAPRQGRGWTNGKEVA